MAVIKFVCGFIFACILTGTAQAQGTAAEDLGKAKQYFWQARFDSAKYYLNEVLRIRTAPRNILFEAYLFKGFVASREEEATEVRQNFIQAIKTDPERKIDETFFPPDLVELFNSVRKQIVGCIFINSEPVSAEITLLGERMNDTSTPTMFCNLTNKEFELIITKPGYQEQYARFQLTAGKTDTLFLNLQPKMVQETGGSKWWLWATLGGAVATSAAVVFTTMIDNGGEAAGGGGGSPLPFPPDHPTR